MMRLLRRGLLLGCALLPLSGVAFPCGGGGDYPIYAPLMPPASYLADALLEDPRSYDPAPPSELLFLYPLVLRYSREVGTAWDYGVAEAMVSTMAAERQKLTEAIAAGDLAGAKTTADSIVQQVLERPATFGDVDTVREALRDAVELLELAPGLKGVPATQVAAKFGALGAPVRGLKREEMAAWADAHPGDPRMPSLRFVALQEAFKREIPDGWREDIRQRMTPEGWQRLERLTDQWLTAWPAHPLADLVRLQRLRISYLSGNNHEAWQQLLAMWPRRLGRLVAEMGFLVRQGQLGGVDSLVSRADLDPALRTALLGTLTADQVSPARWDSLWHFAAAHPRDGWARNLETRLLAKAAQWGDSVPLPRAFPPLSSNPGDSLTPALRWGTFRALALMRVGRIDDALAQTAAGNMLPSAASIRARLLLGRQEWTRAITVPDLDEYARRYLVWVLAPDSVLTTLAAGRDTAGAHAAQQVRAVRALQRVGWDAAIPLLGHYDPKWDEARRLSRDTSITGRLAYARYLGTEGAGLFAYQGRMWYRTLTGRMGWVITPTGAANSTGLPWQPAEESAAIRQHLFDFSWEDFTLKAYAEYFRRAPAGHRDLRAAVAEADRLYNRVLQLDFGASGLWGDYLPQSPEAAAIREAGRKVRS